MILRAKNQLCHSGFQLVLDCLPPRNLNFPLRFWWQASCFHRMRSPVQTLKLFTKTCDSRLIIWYSKSSLLKRTYLGKNRQYFANYGDLTFYLNDAMVAVVVFQWTGENLEINVGIRCWGASRRSQMKLKRPKSDQVQSRYFILVVFRKKYHFVLKKRFIDKWHVFAFIFLTSALLTSLCLSLSLSLSVSLCLSLARSFGCEEIIFYNF